MQPHGRGLLHLLQVSQLALALLLLAQQLLELRLELALLVRQTSQLLRRGLALVLDGVIARRGLVEAGVVAVDLLRQLQQPLRLGLHPRLRLAQLAHEGFQRLRRIVRRDTRCPAELVRAQLRQVALLVVGLAVQPAELRLEQADLRAHLLPDRRRLVLRRRRKLLPRDRAVAVAVHGVEMPPRTSYARCSRARVSTVVCRAAPCAVRPPAPRPRLLVQRSARSPPPDQHATRSPPRSNRSNTAFRRNNHPRDHTVSVPRPALEVCRSPRSFTALPAFASLLSQGTHEGCFVRHPRPAPEPRGC